MEWIRHCLTVPHIQMTALESLTVAGILIIFILCAYFVWLLTLCSIDFFRRKL